MAELWQRLGLVVNPVAGADKKQSLRAAREVIERSRAQSVLTGAAELGAAALAEWRGRTQICSPENDASGSPPGREETRSLACALLREDVDALVVVGGDGTLADVAQVCLQNDSRVPIVGIGCGSTNVGRLITLPVHRASEFDVARVETWNPDCLLASLNGTQLGLAFNDVVIGHTVVATIDGQRQDADAYERMQGKLVPGKPRLVGNSQTEVTRVDSGMETLIAKGEGIGTVIFGFAEPRFVGKAITGAVCLAALCAVPAGCLVCDRPLAMVDVTAAALRTAAPVASCFVAFDEAMEVKVEGIDGAMLCADGNPLHRLQHTDRVVVSVRRNAVTAVRTLDARLG